VWFVFFLFELDLVLPGDRRKCRSNEMQATQLTEAQRTNENTTLVLGAQSAETGLRRRLLRLLRLLLLLALPVQHHAVDVDHVARVAAAVARGRSIPAACWL
jgi:hypothetical protein